MIIVLGILIGILFSAIGMFVIASGQVFLCIRETALNTRNDKSQSQSNYNSLIIVAKLNNFFGWVIVAAGWIGCIILIISVS